MRRRFAAPALVLIVTLEVAGLSARGAAAVGVRAGSGPVSARSYAMGELTLRPCRVAARALCGSIERYWEPRDQEVGTITVGFAFVPARVTSRPAIGTLVPHEGGPGYSTTGSASSYVQMYGPLLQRRNLLLVDQRGTGRSEPIDCPPLQNLVGVYRIAAGRCGRSLGVRSDDYGTRRSPVVTATACEVFSSTAPTRPTVGPRGTRPRLRRCAGPSLSCAGGLSRAATRAAVSCPPSRGR